jgi:hypothetical protein
MPADANRAPSPATHPSPEEDTRFDAASFIERMIREAAGLGSTKITEAWSTLMFRYDRTVRRLRCYVSCCGRPTCEEIVLADIELRNWDAFVRALDTRLKIDASVTTGNEYPRTTRCGLVDGAPDLYRCNIQLAAYNPPKGSFPDDECHCVCGG